MCRKLDGAEVMDQCLLGSDRRFKSSVICSVVAGSEVF